MHALNAVRRRFKKPEPPHVRGLCVQCGKSPQKCRSNGTFRPLCSYCEDKLYSPGRWRGRPLWRTRYRAGVSLVCARCGFVARHKCQIDVHHKDRNHHNNAPDNLENLCANCHRLEHT